MRFRRDVRGIAAAARVAAVRFDAGREARVQIRARMRKRERGVRSGSVEAAIGVRQPSKHRVRRRHRRQAEEDALGASAREQPMRERHRRLGLAAAGQILDHREQRPVRQRHGFRPDLHGRGQRDAGKQLLHPAERGRSRWREPGGGQGGSGAGQGVLVEIGGRVRDRLDGCIREPRLAGADPVGERRQPGEIPGQSHHIALAARIGQGRRAEHLAHGVRKGARRDLAAAAEHGVRLAASAFLPPAARDGRRAHGIGDRARHASIRRRHPFRAAVWLPCGRSARCAGDGGPSRHASGAAAGAWLRSAVRAARRARTRALSPETAARSCRCRAARRGSRASGGRTAAASISAAAARPPPRPAHARRADAWRRLRRRQVEPWPRNA